MKNGKTNAVIQAQAQDEEFEKCKQDPVYFYNKYCKREGMPDLTPEQYEYLQILANNPWLRKSRMYRSGTLSLETARRLTQYPVSINDAYKKE